MIFPLKRKTQKKNSRKIDCEKMCRKNNKNKPTKKQEEEEEEKVENHIYKRYIKKQTKLAGGKTFKRKNYDERGTSLNF